MSRPLGAFTAVWLIFAPLALGSIRESLGEITPTGLVTVYEERTPPHAPCLMLLRQPYRLNGHGTCSKTDKQFQKWHFRTEGVLKSEDSSNS
ncbi:hypothetical protein AVEN_30702-1 [Araneus ventricosus]|uniref:Uncharacterized protein n=1 Tax=Araneus ventricosus TaxID=182803 RepID=A0A4Y2IZR5_ARAVE|nr:hypothetical protein AVEN_30702-1 [Araneus ventricosus]